MKRPKSSTSLPLTNRPTNKVIYDDNFQLSDNKAPVKDRIYLLISEVLANMFSLPSNRRWGEWWMSPPANSITSLEEISMVYDQFQKAWSIARWPIFLEKMYSVTVTSSWGSVTTAQLHTGRQHMLNLNKTERCGYQGKGLHRLWKEKESAWGKADRDVTADSGASTCEWESMWDIRWCWCTASLTSARQRFFPPRSLKGPDYVPEDYPWKKRNSLFVRVSYGFESYNERTPWWSCTHSGATATVRRRRI